MSLIMKGNILNVPSMERIIGRGLHLMAIVPTRVGMFVFDLRKGKTYVMERTEEESEHRTLYKCVAIFICSMLQL